MKAYIFSFLLLMLPIIGNAQLRLVNSFSLSSTGDTYGIFYDINCESPNKILIQMDGGEGMFMELSDISIGKIVKFLEKDIDKFNKWSEIARDNGVALLSKEMDYLSLFSNEQTVYFCNGGDWYKEAGANCKTVFYVDRNGRTSMSFSTTDLKSTVVLEEVYLKSFLSKRLVSTTKETVSSAGAELVFSTVAEIETFIDKIQSVTALKEINRSNKKLFTR